MTSKVVQFRAIYFAYVGICLAVFPVNYSFVYEKTAFASLSKIPFLLDICYSLAIFFSFTVNFKKFYRLSLIGFLVCYSLVLGPIGQFYGIHIFSPPILVTLLLWLGNTSKTKLNDDTILKSIRLLVASIYLGSAVSKICLGGFGWFSAENIKNHLTRIYLLNDNPSLLWLSQNDAILWAVCLLTILFEFGFIFAVGFERFIGAFAIAGLAFHLILLQLTGLNFVYVFLGIYAIFLPMLPNPLKRGSTQNTLS